MILRTEFTKLTEKKSRTVFLKFCSSCNSLRNDSMRSYDFENRIYKIDRKNLHSVFFKFCSFCNSLRNENMRYYDFEDRIYKIDRKKITLRFFNSVHSAIHSQTTV
jgi:ribosomal protein L37E